MLTKPEAVRLRHLRDTLGVMFGSPRLNKDEKALFSSVLKELALILEDSGFKIEEGRGRCSDEEVFLDKGWEAYW